MNKLTKAVVFNHGKESGAWGTKISRLAPIAERKGFSVESIDYSNIADPDERVQILLASCPSDINCLVLVGSSMGGYVATIASHELNPTGLFLMAPAFYLSNYANQNPVPVAKKSCIVHGWQDDVIPVKNSFRIARKYAIQLHLVDSDHRLISQIQFLEAIFRDFLDDISILSE